MDYICGKASKRPYAIRVLNHSGDLTRIYCSFVRLILEYACPVWHFSLTEKLSHQIEQIQTERSRLYYPEDIKDENNKLNERLPKPKEHVYPLRNPRHFQMNVIKSSKTH